MNQRGAVGFQRLLGQELASVVLVRNYLQLTFDGPQLTLNVWPRICAERELQRADSGYLDALAALIGRCVTSIEETKESLALTFDNSVTLACIFADSAVVAEGDRAVFGDDNGVWAWV